MFHHLAHSFFEGTGLWTKPWSAARILVFTLGFHHAIIRNMARDDDFFY